MSGHVYCFHYTTCTKPGKWAVMCIVTITLPVQTRTMRVHVYCHHYTTYTKPGQWAVMCNVTITLPVKSQVNERSCVLLPLHYLCKASTMSSHAYCYNYTTCTKPGQWEVMCIATITLPVQSQDNERSCFCYHYTTCTKADKRAVMCILSITLPVQSLDNGRSCVLLPLHYLYKSR